MPRPRRAGEADGFYHALNRGHGWSPIFWTDDDDFAFERILAEGVAEYDVSVFSFPSMPNIGIWYCALSNRSQRSEGDSDDGYVDKFAAGTHYKPMGHSDQLVYAESVQTMGKIKGEKSNK